MSDELNEIEKLKAKVSQLLSEKKAVQTQRDELKQELEAITSDRDLAQSELKRITVDLPRGEVLDSIAVEGMSETLKRELEHHFEIVRADDGTDLFYKDGKPMELDGKPVHFSPEGIQKINEKGIIKIGSLIRGRGASGGNAQGGTKITTNSTAKPSAPRNQFGFR